jgi:hypothetical protein
MAASLIEFPSGQNVNVKQAVSLMPKVYGHRDKKVIAVITRDPRLFKARSADKWYAASAT